MRVAILNIAETGHRAVEAVKPAVLEFFGENCEITATGNLFIGAIDVSDLEATLRETVTRVDSALEQILPKADAIVIVLTGPILIASVALQRIIRRAAYKVILIAQFDFQRKKYVFVEDRKLLEIIHRG